MNALAMVRVLLSRLFKPLVILLCIVAVLAVMTSALNSWNPVSTLGIAIDNFFNPRAVAQVDHMGMRLQSAIVGAQLQTNTGSFEHELRIQIENGFAGGYSATYRVNTTFETGFDLVSFEANDETVQLNTDAAQWTLRLPAPQVLSCSPDVVDVTFEEWGVRTPSQMGMETRKLAEFVALEVLRREVQSNDQHYATARNEARRILTDLLSPIAAEGGTTVQIMFGSTNDSPWIASCAPQVPACFSPSQDQPGLWLWEC